MTIGGDYSRQDAAQNGASFACAEDDDGTNPYRSKRTWLSAWLD